MPTVYLPQILLHSKDNKKNDRVYSLDIQPYPNYYSVKKLEKKHNAFQQFLKQQIESEKEEESNEEGTKKITNNIKFVMVTSGADEFVHVWRVYIKNDVKMKCLSRLIGHNGEINCVRFNKNGRYIASGGEDKFLYIWEKSTKPKHIPLGYDNSFLEYKEWWSIVGSFRCSGVINTIVWSTNDVLYIASEDNNINILEFQKNTNTRVKILEGHSGMVQGICVDFNNEFLASLSADQTLKLWKKKIDGKSWKLENSIKNIKKDELEKRGLTEKEKEREYEFDPDKIKINEEEEDCEGDIVERKFKRCLYSNEEMLPSFFRRIDFSPNGEFLVTPCGWQFEQVESLPNEIIHNKEIPNSTSNTNNTNTSYTTSSIESTKEIYQSNMNGNLEENVKITYQIKAHSCLYIYHRNLFIKYSIPFFTIFSNTNQFLVVRFNNNTFSLSTQMKMHKRYCQITQEEKDEISESNKKRRIELVNDNNNNNNNNNNRKTEEEKEKEEEEEKKEHQEEVQFVKLKYDKTLLYNDENINEEKTESISSTISAGEEAFDYEPEIQILQKEGKEEIEDKENKEEMEDKENKEEIEDKENKEEMEDKENKEESKMEKEMRFIYAVGTLDGCVYFFDSEILDVPIAMMERIHLCPITDITWNNLGNICACSSSDGYISICYFDKTELGSVKKYHSEYYNTTCKDITFDNTYFEDIYYKEVEFFNKIKHTDDYTSSEEEPDEYETETGSGKEESKIKRITMMVGNAATKIVLGNAAKQVVEKTEKL